MRVVVAFVAIGISVSAPARAQAPNPPAPQTPVAATSPTKPGDSKPKVVCKRVPVVGSNVGTERVCTVRGDPQKTSDGQVKPPEDTEGRKGN